MSLQIFDDYLSIGGNRHTAASAWSRSSGALAFGADQNVAIWYPSNGVHIGIHRLLNGHQDKVTAVAFLETTTTSSDLQLISGSADGTIVVWTAETGEWRISDQTKAHEGSINIVACVEEQNIFATGGSNAEIKLWRYSDGQLKLISSVIPKPRIIPLALALGQFPSSESGQGLFLAVGGTRNDIQVYVIDLTQTTPVIELQAVLRGHEGWIRSLTLKSTSSNGLLLASASADKYVRLWKFSSAKEPAEKSPMHSTSDIGPGTTLQAKTQTISIGAKTVAITFEALLLGHEDWVYSVAWSPENRSDQILTASADGTLAIWEPDPSSGIWISTSKLGEISGQKGATTATGSAGGFWNALWSPTGDIVTCLGRTGSWRVWKHDKDTAFWQQIPGISGHTGSANGLAWSAQGQYLLSTSSDQTTRLHAEWRSSKTRSWHEFSRPQIHGYDLNCISPVSDHRFASGADEKLLRVFDEPKDIAAMLKNLCDIKEPKGDNLPEMAAIPVLGLSNKAVGEEDESFTEVSGKRDQDNAASSVLETSLAAMTEPPNEDVLARHTLWPEHEKLYGHGYEISESATCDRYLATACKASSTEHAVIRIYDTTSWAELKPPLQAHSLTVTRLAWSNTPNPYLLSVGRDRQWACFGRANGGPEFSLLQSNPKAHSRMILDAAWSPVADALFFATAGRDKTIKLWHHEKADVEDETKKGALNFKEQLTIKRETSVTAISFTCDEKQEFAILAAGEENGSISLHVFDIAKGLSLVRSIDLQSDRCPTKSICRLAWRNRFTIGQKDELKAQLAVAAADGSVRVLRVHLTL